MPNNTNIWGPKKAVVWGKDPTSENIAENVMWPPVMCPLGKSSHLPEGSTLPRQTQCPWTRKRCTVSCLWCQFCAGAPRLCARILPENFPCVPCWFFSSAASSLAWTMWRSDSSPAVEAELKTWHIFTQMMGGLKVFQDWLENLWLKRVSQRLRKTASMRIVWNYQSFGIFLLWTCKCTCA